MLPSVFCLRLWVTYIMRDINVDWPPLPHINALTGLPLLSSEVCKALDIPLKRNCSHPSSEVMDYCVKLEHLQPLHQSIPLKSCVSLAKLLTLLPFCGKWYLMIKMYSLSLGMLSFYITEFKNDNFFWYFSLKRIKITFSTVFMQTLCTCNYYG